MQALLDPGQGERIQGSTLHACAMNLLNNERADNDTAELDKAVLDDLQFQNDASRSTGEVLSRTSARVRTKT